MLKNWIKSGFIFINDIIDNNGNIDEQNIYVKLKNKTNWIAEVSSVKSAIPKLWNQKLMSEESKKSIVKTDLKLFVKLKSGVKENIQNTDNKQIRNILIEAKFTKPYVEKYWSHYLESIINWEKVYTFIHNIKDNRIRQLKYKLIHKIIPSKEQRYIWKISADPLCPICKEPETYMHLFIKCKAVETFWLKIENIFKLIGVNHNVKKLKNIIIGYKINSVEYYPINNVFALIAFVIYEHTNEANAEQQKLTYLTFLTRTENHDLKHTNEKQCLR